MWYWFHWFISKLSSYRLQTFCYATLAQTLRHNYCYTINIHSQPDNRASGFTYVQVFGFAKIITMLKWKNGTIDSTPPRHLLGSFWTATLPLLWSRLAHISVQAQTHFNVEIFNCPQKPQFIINCFICISLSIYEDRNEAKTVNNHWTRETSL